jgi:hypothetical protein
MILQVVAVVVPTSLMQTSLFEQSLTYCLLLQCGVEAGLKQEHMAAAAAAAANSSSRQAAAAAAAANSSNRQQRQHDAIRHCPKSMHCSSICSRRRCASASEQ